MGVDVPSTRARFGITVDMWNKTSTRIVESSSVRFVPAPLTSPMDELTMQVSKLGSWVDPADVALNGSRHLHGLDDTGGVGFFASDRTLAARIITVDGTTSCVGRYPTPYPTPLNEAFDPGAGFAANIHNNVWNTCYILFYPYLAEDSDLRQRYVLDLDAAEARSPLPWSRHQADFRSDKSAAALPKTDDESAALMLEADAPHSTEAAVPNDVVVMHGDDEVQAVQGKLSSSALTTKGKLHRERALNSTLDVAAVAAASRSWFLRPSGERKTADGKSFDTAWAEVQRVKWEAIKPSDTLFVCGLGSGPFVLPAGFSGAEGSTVTIDGSCPRPDGSVDQALWIGGDLIGAPFPAGWSGPDAAGIYSSAYAGDAAYGLAVAPNASDMAHLTRLRRGACDASGPTNVSSWPADTFCEGPRTHSPAEARGQATVYYKPASASQPAHIFGSLLGVLITTNNSDLVIANMRVAFGARLLDINGGARVTLRNNTLKWASQNGISFNSKAGHSGPHPGTQGALVTRNRISECACGLYIINQNDSAKIGFFPNYMNSNDLVISHNNFTSIDPFNFYHNKDTHAIGVQGGSRCVFEHNTIDGAGGSGITFYQGPGQLMEDNVARFNTILNIRDAEGEKNQRGIEFCDDNRAGNRRDSNNSFYYNVLANITGVAIRSKALRPAAASGGHGPGPLAKCGWRFLNNVVLDAGVSFELQAMAGNPDPQGSCAINNIFACGLGGQPCDPGYRHQVGVPANATTMSNNLYYPDRDTYFCASGKEGAASGCTGFADWTKKHSNNAGTESAVADPQFADASRWPGGLRPTAGSAAAAHGRPVGLSTDFAGVPVPGGKPDLGAFQISAKTDEDRWWLLLPAL